MPATRGATKKTQERPLRVLVGGASGRSGSRVAALAAADPRFVLAGVLRHERPVESHGAPEFPMAELDLAATQADVLVDFSTPEAAVHFAKAAGAAGKPFVTGTTGFSTVQLAQLKAQRIPVFIAANFSPGVHALTRLCAEAARALPGFQLSILETHHKDKRDAPSGTALRLVQTLLETRPGLKDVPVSSRRIGDVIGEHVLTLAGPCERLELAHHAESRDVFARGALDAALWLRRKKAGLYGMEELMKTR